MLCVYSIAVELEDIMVDDDIELRTNEDITIENTDNDPVNKSEDISSGYTSSNLSSGTSSPTNASPAKPVSQRIGTKFVSTVGNNQVLFNGNERPMLSAQLNLKERSLQMVKLPKVQGCTYKSELIKTPTNGRVHFILRPSKTDLPQSRKRLSESTVYSNFKRISTGNRSEQNNIKLKGMFLLYIKLLILSLRAYYISMFCGRKYIFN